MRITTIRSEGLAALSYFVSSENEAMVIDPRRDALVYHNLAIESESKISHIFETHRNEDYVTGSLELQSYAPKAEIGHSKETRFGYGDIDLSDDASFKIGKMAVTCLHTPGHTDDCMCYVVADTTVSSDPIVAFTGDTLFVNEVGRTDLVDINKHSQMSKKLFNSLHEKVLPLGDDVIIHPGHGAGSVCGGAIGDREFSTIGYERKNNIWLSMDEAEFVRSKLNQRLTRAPYFKRCEKLNTDGPQLLCSIETLTEIGVPDFKKLLKEENHQAIDTRPTNHFLEKYIPGTISLSLPNMGLLSAWSLNSDSSISIILEHKNDLEEAWSYLVRVGLDNIIGFLKGGLSGWSAQLLEFQTIPQISLESLQERITDDTINVVDVREPYEFEDEHIPNSQNIPLTQIGTGKIDEFKGGTTAIMCPSGYRSTTAASLFRRAGFNDVVVPVEGLKGWRQKGYPLSTALHL